RNNIHDSSLAAGLLALILAFGFGPAIAQEGGAQEGEQAEEKTKRTGSMSERVYKRLAEAQQMADEENFNGAVAKLNEVKAMAKLSDYEKAQLYTFFGFIYYNQERYKDSISAYKTVLEQPDLPEGLRVSTTYTLAQLYFTVEDYDNAIRQITDWMKVANNPGPDPYVLLASAYYSKEQYQQMIEPLESALRIAKERDIAPKEQWYLLQRVAYWELKNNRKVRDILETLVVGWPKKEYWTQLSAMYGELEQEKKQLAAYEAAYDQGLLERSGELIQLAQLFMAADAPYKGARVLEKGMEAEQVEKDAKNQKLLAQAWSMAREDSKAIPALQAAAKLSSDGELDVRLAQTYLNLSRYDECIKAARAGLNKGSLKRADTANMVLGMCLYDSGSLGSAKKAFRQAAKDKRSASGASSWIQYIEGEEERLRKLEESMRMVERRAETAEAPAPDETTVL
ncbi:MAG: hypothetical protein ACR2P6_08455, partial [Gammaproteobacteria bacterium]